MKKYLAALLVAVGMLLVMAVPAFAQDEFPGQGSGATDSNPGNTEASRSVQSTPPQQKPGAIRRNIEANEHDTGIDTGRSKRID
jgi:hypothetical protein